MPQVQVQAVPTTTTGSPDDATRALEHALFRCDLYGITEQLAAGANLELECMVHEMRDGKWLTNLTAVSWAVTLDSEADGLFLTPLLLHHGGNIAQVDSEGRTLLSFARSRSVLRYLIEHGAPFMGGASAREVLLALVADPSPKSIEECEKALALLGVVDRAEVTMALAGKGATGWALPLLPKSKWRKVLDNDHFAVLKHFGYGDQARVSADVARDLVGPPPLLAAFHPAEVIGWALEARDAERVRRLVKYGGANGDYRFTRSVEVDGVPVELRGLTATGLALLIDCENERLSAGGRPLTSLPVVSPVFTSLLMRVRSLHGAHDVHGNSLLHLTMTPGMCSWLLEKGLPADVRNDAGQLPEDVVPEYVREVIERHRFAVLPLIKSHGRKGC
ncbi:hypothetical protein [Dyella sp. A6]|uniref:hypothetical protein n=1 Tax=Dyella aluminiiresistens TaxID=3069105 RepID=UPI002E79A372|nr:hypothetical protein [Dyella sp. A6]